MLFEPFFGRVFFEADGGSNAGGNGDDPAKPAGFKPITTEDELREWKASTRGHLIAEIRADLKNEQEQREQTEREQRERDEAEKRGEFDKVRQSLESERDTAASERDALKVEHDALTGYFAGQYAQALKELPEVITAFAPADDASFAVKSAWLAKAQAQAAKVGTTTQPGNKPNPKAGGGAVDVTAAVQQARSSGRYTL